MRNILQFVVIVVYFMVNPILGHAESGEDDPTRLIVKYKEDSVELDQTFKEIDTINEAKVIEVESHEVDEVKSNLEEDASVEFVEEEQQYSFFQNVNDPLYRSYQAVDVEYIQGSRAWDIFKPKATRLVVAIIDSGIDRDHPELKNKIVKPYNVMNPGSYPVDDVGHGTHVAGIVGAETNNGIGIASVSKGVDIMPVKVGNKSSLSTFDIAKGIVYAVDNGANIINISIGGAHSQIVQDACEYADSKGVLVIAAAGNEATNTKTYPAALAGVIGVGAVDSYSDSLTTFSNYGQWVSVAAPGQNIYSTYPQKDYSYMSGTSMASPMVASLASLIKIHAPKLAQEQIRWIMESSSKPFTGSELLQNGRIDAYESLKLYENYARLYGATSVETSNKIATDGWSQLTHQTLKPQEPDLNPTLKGEEGSFVVLASNQSFPDSLAASALASKLDAPILLTFPKILKETTVNQLQELGATDVLLLGGKEAISENVENGLKDKGYNLIRISGADRYKTAVQINNYIADQGGTVIVANGKNYPDALSIASYSGKLQYPIVFVEKDVIPEDTKRFLKKYNFKNTIIVGGTSVISEKVQQSLPNPTRIAGSNRYDTNIKVNSYFNKGSKISGFIFATGANFPDALSGGVLSNKLGYPLLLVDKNRVLTVTNSYVRSQVNAMEVEEVDMDMVILGGEAAVSSETVWEIDKLLYESYYDQLHFQSNSQKGTEITNQTE